MKNTNINVGKMVRLAVLVAIILVMSFTPLGYLRTPVIEITFIMIPVAIAAIVIGPAGGAIAGGVFGVTSFIQCFGMSPFGAVLLSINPVYTFIICMIPRIIAGWLPGFIYRAVNRIGKNRTTSAISASLAAPLLNTVLFVLTLYLLFGKTEFVMGFGERIWDGFVTIVGINGLVEAGVGFIVGTTVSRALVHFFPEQSSHGKTDERAAS